MVEKLIIAGAGGQGIMLLGKIIAESVMREDKFVTWLPAYGAEVRGGTAYCMVVISDAEIGSPYIASANTLIAMNQPSWDKFQKRLDTRGVSILNSSMIAHKALGHNQRACACTDLACGLGNIKVANMIALGYYLAIKKIVRPETVREVIAGNAPAGKHELIAINHKALECGMESAYGKSTVCS